MQNHQENRKGYFWETKKTRLNLKKKENGRGKQLKRTENHRNSGVPFHQKPKKNKMIAENHLIGASLTLLLSKYQREKGLLGI